MTKKLTVLVAIIATCAASAHAGTNDVYWAPTDLADTIVWLDASDTNTLWADIGGTTQATTTVARWDDKSGDGNHQLQTSSGNQPLTGSRTISNINAIAFDGDNDYMQEAANAFGAKVSDTAVFMVLWWDQARYQGILDLTGDASWALYERGKLCQNANGTRSWDDWVEWDKSGLVGRGSLHTLYYSQSESVFQAWTDGDLKITKLDNGDDSTSSGIRIVYSADDEFDGLFGEVVILDGTVTTQDRQTVEGYLAHKWDLETNLSQDHPYRYAIPGAEVQFSDLVYSNITPTSAVLYATAKTALTSAAIVWDTSDKGTTNLSDWAGTNTASGSTPGTISGNATNLTTDTAYVFRFYGDDGTTNGWSTPCTFASALSAANIPAFTSITSTHNSVTLTWTDNSDTETGFVLQRSTNGVSFNYSASVGASVTSYVDQAVAVGRTYTYRLYATNTLNESSTDPTACETSAPPTALSGDMIFYENFEEPVVDGETGVPPTGWRMVTGANEGLNDRTDVVGKTGDQLGWVMRYGGTLETTTGLTNTLEAGVNYTITADLSFERNDTAGIYATTALKAGLNTLAVSTNPSTASKDLTAQSVSLSFTASPDNPYLGEPLRIRLSGNYWRPFWDNLSLTAVPTTNDTAAPTPTNMVWIGLPTSSESNSITMQATNAVDADNNGVEYFFTNTINGNVSGWQESPIWSDTGLTPGMTYSYKVRARDKSENLNETGWSSVENATCEAYIILYESFEEPSIRPAGSRGFSSAQWFLPVDGWVGSSDNYQRLVSELDPPTPTTTPFGEQYADSRGGYIETTTTLSNYVLQANYTYRVVYNTGCAGDRAGEENGVPGDDSLELYAGSTSVASNAVSLTKDDFSETHTLEFTPGAGHPNLGEPLKIRMSKTAGEWWYFIIYDNVKVYAIPQDNVMNTTVDNVTGTSADLFGTLDSRVTNFNVSVYWSTTDHPNSAAWLGDGSASNAPVGSYTNVVGQLLSNSVSSLSANTTYYYTFMATNSATDLWADTNGVFTTLDLPVVTDSTGGSPATETSATISGKLTAGALANAWICWGSTEGGTNRISDWENAVSIEAITQDEEFSTLVSGLVTNGTYWYRCYVSNSLGAAWSDPETSFSGIPFSPLNSVYVGVNFVGSAGADGTLDPGDVAGYVSQTNWNNMCAASQNETLTTVYDSMSNALAGMEVDTSVGNWDARVTSTQPHESGPYTNLFEGFIEDNDNPGGNNTRVTVTNIPSSWAWFDVYIYMNSKDNGQLALRLNGGGVTNYAHQGAYPEYLWPILCTDTSGPTLTAEICNVMRYTSVTGSALDIDWNRDGGTIGLSGIQLVGTITNEWTILNKEPTGVASNEIVFNATLNAASTNYDVHVYWGTSDGGTNPGSWAGNEYVGSWTNVTSTNISYLRTGLVGGATYWYTFRATNATTNVWAEPSWSFKLPNSTIDNLFPSDVLDTTATARGKLSAPATNYAAYVHWGATDGTTNPLSWTYSASLGSWTNVSSTNLSHPATGFTAGATNYYSFRASNAVDNIWASPSMWFVTYDQPIVNNSTGATVVSETSATLRGTLTDGVSAATWICWGTNDSGTSSTGDWDSVVPMGTIAESGTFITTATGLATNQTYWYRCYASNAVGTDWSGSATSFSGTPVDEGGGSGYSMQVTFTNFAGKGTLTNFPALVRFTMSNITNYIGFLDTTNGWDLRFWTNSTLDGDDLRYEVESFATDTNSYVWVKIPELTNNLSIWASWGDAAYNSQETYTTNGDVWTEGFEGVWHLSSSGTAAPDSSPNSYNGTVQNQNGTDWTTAVISEGYDFSQNNEYIETSKTAGDFSVGGTNVRTFSIWAYTRSNVGGLWECGEQSTRQCWCLRPESSTTDWRIQLWGDDLDFNYASGNTWVHYVMTYDGSAVRVYADGGHVATKTPGAALNTVNNETLTIGEYNDGEFNGVLDEFRVCDVLRSTNWIWACWMNQGTNHDSFVQYGTPESAGTTIANLAPTAITHNQATLNASLGVPGTDCAVYVYWGGTNGGTNVSGWTSDAYVGSWTNAVTNISFSTNTLSGDSTNWYTFVASNAASGRIWAKPSWMFITPGEQGPLTIENLGATNVQATSTYLTGDLTGQGAGSVTITVYWGDEDGGTSTGSWDTATVVGAGMSAGTFSKQVSHSPNKLYSYRCHANDGSQTAWSPQTMCWMGQQVTASDWQMISVPLQWGDSSSNALNATLGSVLADGLTGGADDENADSIFMVSSGTNWTYFWLDGSDDWQDSSTNAAATNIAPGVGFWLKTIAGSSGTIPFAGYPHTNATEVTFESNAWSMFSWPWATPGEQGATGWGFDAAGAVGAWTYQYADEILGKENGQWFSIYMKENGLWYKRGSATLTTVKLRAGQAYYYKHKGAGSFNWTAPAP